MPKHEHLFLDDKGLKQLLRRIKETFSTKTELRDSISEEIHNREEADSFLDTTLRDLIGDESEARLLADESLQSNIDSEEAARILRDKELGDSLTAEIENRETSISNLRQYVDEQDTGINDDIDSLSLHLNEVANDLYNEISTTLNFRETANTKFDNIDSEIVSLKSKDTTIEGSISDLETSLGQEAIYRQDADNQVRQDLQSIINEEARLRSEEDNKLQHDIGVIYKSASGEEGTPDYVPESGILVNKLTELNNSIQSKIDSIYKIEGEEESGILFNKVKEESEARRQADDELMEFVRENSFNFKFKGYVDNFEDLPTENLSRGDMYCVRNECVVEGMPYSAGTNFVWDGNKWFALSSSLDLSEYYKKSEIDTMLDEKVDNNTFDSEVERIDSDLLNKVSSDVLENELNTKVGYAVVDESTHELVLKATENSDTEIARISGIGGGGGGEGTDPELRHDFEQHIISENPHPALSTIINAKASKGEVSDLSARLDNHLESENAHTPAQVGLGNVANLAPENLPVSTATQTALDLKADKTELQEGLISKADKIELNIIQTNIENVESKVDSFGRALSFKGLVATLEELNNIQDPSIGDCYQIVSDIDESVTDKSHDGEMHAYSENGWVKIISSAQDLSSLIATPAEINEIIENYI